MRLPHTVMNSSIKPRLLFTLSLLAITAVAFSQPVQIMQYAAGKYIVFGNEKMRLRLDYNGQAVVTEMQVSEQPVMKTGDGIYSAIRTANASYSTQHILSAPVVKVSGNRVSLTGIVYGDDAVHITEDWTFTITATNIQFRIDRKLAKTIVAEQVGFPLFIFNSINTWEGAYQDYGGLAWFYLFNQPLDTYGVHSSSAAFWNKLTSNGLSISVAAQGKQVAMDFSRTATNKLSCTVAFDEKEMQPRFDSAIHRRRFIRGANNVWSPITLKAGTTSETINLQYFNWNQKYDRGKMPGVNGKQVSAVLNTIARIGVIDKQHFGGNSWHTPYGPICLHEQYIAQMGLGINDSNYLKGYKECLDFYRDNAIKPDGRVWARWAYNNEDMMDSLVNARGFYEARWGYLMDANPDLVTNVAELYQQNGDLAWVRQHQRSCEKALGWIMKRDSNNNGLVEMLTDDHTQQKGSDWIDIIWASYENAFVNAKLYRALVLWADIERQLGDTDKAIYYGAFAEKLRSSFNKPVAGGGFWDEEKQCYIYWRNKDGSPHGNNMVTPVNFMAIAYDICSDTARTTAILEGIETQMQKENLFFWPLCMYPFATGEGKDSQYPFPEYENGDIFLSWGSVAVKAYAVYKPALALKYVRNVLAQYEKDGLAFQRYGRSKQDGRGDDILSGNSLAIIGLYQSVYGINPMYNRFYLNPHITPELNGTQLKYTFRKQALLVSLDTGLYTVSDGHYAIQSKTDFGFFSTNHSLQYFNGNEEKASMTMISASGANLVLSVQEWKKERRLWTQLQAKPMAGPQVRYTLFGLQPGVLYTLKQDGRVIKKIKTSADGGLVFANKNSSAMQLIELSR